MLLQHGADVRAITASGETALHKACQNNHKACTRLLLQHGAEVNAVDSEGRTALHNTCSLGVAACTRVLLQHGADVNAADHYGRTPWDCASNSDGDSDSIMKLLLANVAASR